MSVENYRLWVERKVEIETSRKKMSQTYHLYIREQSLLLSKERCICWENEKVLILSDTHFGKTGHFRKESIPLPQMILENDLNRLIEVICCFNPDKLIVVGDLFHSSFNKELDYFKQFRANFSQLEFHLVLGNHDILRKEYYEDLAIQIHLHSLDMHPFSFVHDINDKQIENDNFYFCGHQHPGVTVRGKARQNLRFPCFHFSENHACLPAFSRFTGMSPIKRNKKDQVFIITEEEVINIPARLPYIHC
ncbi:MAG: ligase-associated DNA damage response endonuclease PdeM [Bacteroidetes bacterium]|nr:ligase-associated DNA damage response endonuclease PdeM [Bacteroidota bacterium]